MNASRPAAPYRKPWVQRHWILTLLLALGTLFTLSLAIGAWMTYSVMDSMRYTPPFIEAMDRARANPEVKAALGEPLEDTFVLGAVEPKEDGVAKLFIFVRGPKGKGDVQIEAVKEQGAWRYHVMRVNLDADHTSIDLL
ncbi:cytochrome c oxidase assembly factor Coa1 family protein [Lysobacter sp. 1R34A]|uniref:cytochrome c oxidase assembly factor Coa1 family protein n=1 Tax=Lysobacter sp. 1R34A TaxID=3445786 RepID=UPI003EEEC2D3